MPFDDDSAPSNHSSNPYLGDILERRLNRRTLLGASGAAVATGLVGAGLVDFVTSPAAGAQPTAPARRGRGPLIGFRSVPTSVADTIVVPPGYTWDVLIAWGDPISNGPAFAPDASNTAEEQALQWGMHNDGLVYFPIDGSERGLLVQNHEYTDDGLLFPDGVANWDAAKTAKSQAAHGVSVIEVRKGRRGWEVKRPSKYARRITAATPMQIAGPAAGHPLMRTSSDPTGTAVLGTINNCAMGFTPWGTYLACEENFNGYFRRGEARPLDLRYGVPTTPWYLWHTTDQRFDLAVEPNEVHRFGWVVEIDPFHRRSTPVKRTALGRIKHEGALVEEARDGRVVVYMGDDERFEYIYRYVSREPWRRAFRRGRHPLDDGTLYVARFDADGTGRWLPLTTDNPALAGFGSLGDILINTRGAADAVGATKMDRPEWIDTSKTSKTVYATLTNNSRRGTGTNPPVDAANPRANNVYGGIIRWSYQHDFTDDTFVWDLFALCGDPAVPAHGSTIVGDKYGSPDGLYVDPAGRIWIQTDVSTSTIDSGAYAGFGNNQMLCADPTTRETRRFLVGPRQCEITGVMVTPDQRTMFVGIQHPGERPDESPGDPANPSAFSSWPDGGNRRPRSATIVIQKADGGRIGT
jgi:secreted PhoX family phosphatase